MCNFFGKRSFPRGGISWTSEFLTGPRPSLALRCVKAINRKELIFPSRENRKLLFCLSIKVTNPIAAWSEKTMLTWRGHILSFYLWDTIKVLGVFVV